jgi:hypothetical protein
MTSALFDRARALRADLEALANVKASANEAGELSDLKDDLAEQVDALRVALAARAVLAEANLPTDLPPSHEALRKRAQQLRERFEKDPSAEVLKKGQVWRTCIELAEATAKTITSTTRSRWQGYEAQIFGGESPSAVERLLAPTPENNAALRRYKACFEELRLQFRTLPSSSQDIAAAKLKANELKEIAKAFNFDVPVDVKAFLEAVLSGGGAPLKLLTPSVIEWLRKTGTYEHYRITALRQA